MGLRSRIKVSYRWRLFLPVMLLVWGIIVVLVAYQYNMEVQFRKQMIRNELAMIDNRILYAHEVDTSIPDFLRFLEVYFDYTMFDNIYVSVYDSRDSLIAYINEPWPLDHEEMGLREEFHTGDDDSREALVDGYDSSTLFYYTSRSSIDGEITVVTGMPYNVSLTKAITVNSRLWWLVVAMTLLSTLVVWFATRMISRNVTVLRDFTRKASQGRIPEVSYDHLPHDELGEITRQILTLYRQRIEAMDKSEKEHKVALHAVEEKARIKRQLTNNLNHELKTPLGVIRGYIETMINDPNMDFKTRSHFLGRTLSNVERLCQLLNDVSTMTRLEESNGQIPVTEVDMHDLLFSIENDVRESRVAGDMTFSFDVPLRCHVRGNHTLLSAMVLNLVKNAALHSRGTRMWVKLISENDKYYVFSFADDGRGVPQEHLPHLFERFYRVDSGRSRKEGGTGLGLPIVKNTVVTLGGAISVKNRTEGGLEFNFSLLKWKGVGSEQMPIKIDYDQFA